MEPRWLDDREQRAWVALLDLWRQLGAGLEQQLAGSDVSGADYQVLAPLSGAPGGRMRPRDLAAAMGWDSSRLSHHLRRMERRGLVAREQHPNDGRGAVIFLTEAGHHAIEHAAPGHVEWVRTHFIELLSAEELDTLTAISERVISELNRQPPLSHSSQGAFDSLE
jgi:DNA-binding MarR family transcriptional regulator